MVLLQIEILLRPDRSEAGDAKYWHQKRLQQVKSAVDRVINYALKNVTPEI